MTATCSCATIGRVNGINKANRFARQAQKVKSDTEELPGARPNVLLADETINKIVEQLLAQGLSRDDIVMPGSAAGKILFIADDFDAPTSDFADYL